MYEEFTYNGINWKSYGYFGCPSPSSDFTWPHDLRKDHLDTWIECFHCSAVGDFRHNHRLVDILIDSAPSPIASSCTALLGSAGDSECFERIAAEINKTSHFWITELLCETLYLRGRLGDITVLLEAFETYPKNTRMITVWLSDLLGKPKKPYSPPTDSSSMKKFRREVMSQVEDLETRVSSCDDLVFQGLEFSVQSFAKFLLERLEHDHGFRSDFRQKFEASTGLDCTTFYLQEQLQPLAATSIIEGFLQSDETTNFETGVRYFFGHRIPSSK